MSSILFVFMLKKHGVGFLPFSELFCLFCRKLFSVLIAFVLFLLSYKSHGLHGLLRALHSHTYIQNTRTAVLSGIWLLPTLHVMVTDKAPPRFAALPSVKLECSQGGSGSWRHPDILPGSACPPGRI